MFNVHVNQWRIQDLGGGGDRCGRGPHPLQLGDGDMGERCKLPSSGWDLPRSFTILVFGFGIKILIAGQLMELYNQKNGMPVNNNSYYK